MTLAAECRHIIRGLVVLCCLIWPSRGDVQYGGHCGGMAQTNCNRFVHGFQCVINLLEMECDDRPGFVEQLRAERCIQFTYSKKTVT